MVTLKQQQPMMTIRVNDGEDGGGDNEDREDDDSDEDYDKKNTGKREQAITLVQLRSSRPSSTP